MIHDAPFEPGCRDCRASLRPHVAQYLRKSRWELLELLSQRDIEIARLRKPKGRRKGRS